MDGLMSKVPPIKGQVKKLKVTFASGAKMKHKFGDHDSDDKLTKKRMKGKLSK